jgi:hypothetical protein
LLFGYNKAYLCRNKSLGFYRRLLMDLPDILENKGYNAQIATGGFSYERTYFGISDRATDKKYQTIGRYISDKEDFLDPLKSLW